MLEYEALGGKVQMVYMDPPYGIKFGSNFQPFVRKRVVKDDDDSISREPEMVQAYRDTWELGLHSWLTYMRDRLLLAHEMLTDSGSCFVQISDENVHHVREVMDEVFGAENFMSLITFKKTLPLGSKGLAGISDYIVWYSKDIGRVKYQELFTDKPVGENTGYTWLELPDKSRRKMTTEEKNNPNAIPKDAKVFFPSTLSSSGYTPTCMYDFELNGTLYKCGKKSWRTHKVGMKKLIEANRIFAPGKLPCYVQYYDDFPVQPLHNLWNDTHGASDISYVVQTSEKVIQRCMLMTTAPGDLVFDPTCGSGSTAYVAEQWGRRWITTDVSRVPLALARQRLLTATYPYYELRDEQRGPAGGFMYKRKQNKKGEEVGGIVPHIKLRSTANNEPLVEEVLVDRPETVSEKVRISGPFCVEAVMPTPLSPEASQVRESTADEYDYIPRMIAALSMSGVQAFKLNKVRVPARAMNIHAEAERADDTGERIAVTFGPMDGPISDYAVVEAGKEASHKGYARLLVVAFAIDPEARQTVVKAEATFGIPALYVQANTDLVMSDLLKNTRSSQLFAVTGLPDISLEKLPEKDEDGGDLWRVTLNGLDIFDPATMELTSLAGDDVPCWMLDTDYDGQCFRAGQIFFPAHLGVG